MSSESILKYSQFFVILMTCYILIYIWYKYNTFFRKTRPFKEEDEVDYGLILLAGGMFVWGIISLAKGYLGPNILKSPVYELLSTINNGLILLSFPFFVHGFKFLRHKRARTNWMISIGVLMLTIVTALLTLTLFYEYNTENVKTYKAISQSMSAITTISLGFIFHNTFTSRKLSGMAFFSWIIMALIFIPQVIIFLESAGFIDWTLTSINEQISLLSTVGLSFLLVSLSLTWIGELSKDLHLNIFSTQNDKFQIEILKENTTFEEFLVKTEEFIKEDQIEEAIELINTFLRNKNLSVLYFNSISVVNQLSRLNLKKIRGVLTDEDYEIRRNKIRSYVLDILKQLINKIKK